MRDRIAGPLSPCPLERLEADARASGRLGALRSRQLIPSACRIVAWCSAHPVTAVAAVVSWMTSLHRASGRFDVTIRLRCS